jgi:aspartate/methionine/tyrosine aminotransferase
MSKAYGLAGLRIGWLATKDRELLDKLVRMKHYTSICSSAPSEKLAVIALKHSDELLRRNVAIIEKNLKIAEDFFDRYPELFEFIRPMAGPVAFVKMNIEKPMDEFCDELVAKQGVLLLPSSIYGLDTPYFRMGFGRENFKESLDQFELFLIENQYV